MPEEQRPASATDEEDESDTVRHAETGKGPNPAQGTPPIGDDQKTGQTQTPAADDDVGVPDHVERRTE